MPLQLRIGEIDRAEIMRPIPLRLVAEVRAGRVVVQAASVDGARLGPVLAEADDGDEAVAVIAIPALGAVTLAGAEAGEAAPVAAGKADRR